MGLFRRKGDKSTAKESSETAMETSNNVGGLNEDAQEVIKDNLAVMYDIVMQIREDEEFARNIYANCPRLQHMLDERPDLRPVFEDPHLVRINFEQVFREQGGVLPEDEPKKPSCLSVIVNHPLFKVFKVLLLIKKVFSFIFGGGFAAVRGCLVGCFAGLCCVDAAEHLASGAADAADAVESNANVTASKEALNKAADHMADPEVQKQMQELLENDAEGLQEAIDNDPDLSALRDSSPFVAELMSDPETMKILTDPDNLRALGEAPGLIESDFVDPDWQPPEDIETGGDGTGVSTGVDTYQEGDLDYGDGEDVEDADEEEDGLLDDYELGETEDNDGNNAANDDNNASKGGNKSKSKDEKSDSKSGGGGFFAQIGAGFTDMLASEFVGISVKEMTGGDDMLPMDIPGEEAAGAAEGAAGTADSIGNATSQVAGVAKAADEFASSDVGDSLSNLENSLNEVENQAEDERNRNAERAAMGAAVGAAAGGAIMGGGAMASGGRQNKSLDADGERESEGEAGETKGRFGFIGKMASKISSAAKEQVAASFLGADLGSIVVDKIDKGKGRKGDEEEGEANKSGNDMAMTEDSESRTESNRTSFSRKR
jgi:hypothetical protein